MNTDVIKAMMYCVLFLLLFSCSNENEIKDGDLLFIAEKSGDLSESINRVTQTQMKTNYSHVALIQVRSDSIWVWESAPAHGIRKIGFDQFIGEQDAEIHRYRLKKEYAKSIEKAWDVAERMLGKSYNFTYILSDTCYYCSDFVYRLLAHDSIFGLEPMTFIDPRTEKPDSGWVKHYEKLGIEIPEGALGCNPNGLAASDKLYYLDKLGDGSMNY